MRIALALGLCLIAFGAVAAPKPKVANKPDVPRPTQSPRDLYRARLNENLITIMAGSPTGTGLSVAYDIAEVLDDKDNLRILPMAGKGPEQNLKDVMFLRGVDLGLTHANILKYYGRTGELGPNFVNEIAYVAKLFNEEIHILARADIADVAALSGQTVNLGEDGSGAGLTGRLVLRALGVNFVETHYGELDAISKLKSGEVAAMIVTGGKPLPVLSNLDDTKELKLLPIPYTKALESDYYPAALNHDDYPELVPAGGRIDTIAVCAVLVAFNWEGDSDRSRKLAKFVDAFFGKFDQFLLPPRHPKWREVNFAATLEGWKRSPVAQAWIDRTRRSAEASSQKSFDTFLAQTTQASATGISDAERAELFRAFLEWSKRQQQNP